MTYIIAVIVIAIAIHYVKSNWKRWRYGKDIVIPAAAKRSDLYWGYYGCLDEQVNEVRGTVNLHMESQFNGVDKAVQNILDAGVDCMLDVSIQVFTEHVKGQYKTVRPDAEQRLRDFFQMLQDRGALKFVKIIYPIDEPNNTVGDLAQLQGAVAIIRRVADLYLGVDGYKLAVIYAADKPFIGQSMYDWIGFDDYDMKSHVLVGSMYQALKASLLPHQRTIIVPGAAYGQDPTPFVNFAQGNSEVAVVMPFLWLDNTNGDVGAPGARSNGMAAQYLAAGKSILENA
jgi:hypothetical protein